MTLTELHSSITAYYNLCVKSAHLFNFIIVLVTGTGCLNSVKHKLAAPNTNHQVYCVSQPPPTVF